MSDLNEAIDYFRSLEEAAGSSFKLKPIKRSKSKKITRKTSGGDERLFMQGGVVIGKTKPTKVSYYGGGGIADWVVWAATGPVGSLGTPGMVKVGSVLKLKDTMDTFKKHWDAHTPPPLGGVSKGVLSVMAVGKGAEIVDSKSIDGGVFLVTLKFPSATTFEDFRDRALRFAVAENKKEHVLQVRSQVPGA